MQAATLHDAGNELAQRSRFVARLVVTPKPFINLLVRAFGLLGGLGFETSSGHPMGPNGHPIDIQWTPNGHPQIVHNLRHARDD